MSDVAIDRDTPVNSVKTWERATGFANNKRTLYSTRVHKQTAPTGTATQISYNVALLRHIQGGVATKGYLRTRIAVILSIFIFST